MTHVMRPSAHPAGRVVAVLMCVVLLSGVSACTSGSDEPSGQASGMSTGATSTLDARPAPLKVRVTRVAGRLRPAQRETLERNVGRVVSSYFRAAFLDGDYPRSDFGDAFATFSRGAVRKATAQRRLLTNIQLGPTTESVTPKEQTAYLSVLAPNRVAAGVTARIRLVFVASRGERDDQQVTLSGRLLLTRRAAGGWQVFGYDVARSVVPAAKGGSR